MKFLMLGGQKWPFLLNFTEKWPKLNRRANLAVTLLSLVELKKSLKLTQLGKITCRIPSRVDDFDIFNLRGSKWPFLLNFTEKWPKLGQRAIFLGWPKSHFSGLCHVACRTQRVNKIGSVEQNYLDCEG